MHLIATHDKILVTFTTKKVITTQNRRPKEFRSQPNFLCHIPLLTAGFTNGGGERKKKSVY